MKLTTYILTLLFSVLILGFFFGCTTTPEKKKIVTVTIQPQKFFAERIAGDKMEINCIVPVGSNPEAYDPSPSHLVHMGKSIAYFKIGYIGFEIAWMDKLIQNNPHMKVYDTSKGIALLNGTHDCAAGDHVHAEESIDPHIWSSPKNALIIAQNMYQAFIELDPKNAAYYKQNYEDLVADIDRIDNEIRQRLAQTEGSMFAIYHPSLSYLARDYGLKQLSIEYNGKEPSVVYIKDAIDVAKKNKVKVIFVQREFDIKRAQVFADAVGCKIVQIAPLSYNWEEELINIADAIAN